MIPGVEPYTQLSPEQELDIAVLDMLKWRGHLLFGYQPKLEECLLRIQEAYKRKYGVDEIEAYT